MTRWLRDIFWLGLVLLALLGWYVHSFLMCPEFPEINARYFTAKAKTEIHAKQIDDGIKRQQKDVEKRKRGTQLEWALVARIRHETRRMEQIEAQMKKTGKAGD